MNTQKTTLDCHSTAAPELSDLHSPQKGVCHAPKSRQVSSSELRYLMERWQRVGGRTRIDPETKRQH